MRKSQYLGQFHGLFTALGDNAPQGYSPDCLNVRVADGAIRPRYGYHQYAAASGDGPTAALGFGRVAGYSSGVSEEWLAVLTVSGKNRLYSISSSGTATAVTKSGTPIDLPSGEYTFFGFDDKAFLMTPHASMGVWKKTTGSATSMAPTTALVAAPAVLASTVQPLSQATSSLFNSASASVTGSASSATANTDYCVVTHKSDTVGYASVTIDLAAAKDWTNLYTFVFSVTPQVDKGFDIDRESVGFSLINNDGSPVTMHPTSVVNNGYYTYCFYFDQRTASEWDNIKKLVFDYTVKSVNAGGYGNMVTIQATRITGPDLALGHADGTRELEFGITQYDTSLSEESPMSVVKLPIGAFEHFRSGNQDPQQRCGYAQITTYNTVDTIKAYYKDPTGYWKLVKTTAYVGSANRVVSLVGFNNFDLVSATRYTRDTFDAAQVVGGCAYKGWAVWLYKAGKSNVRHSRIGEPLKQSVVGDEDTTDANRGATYTMSDDLADEPVGAVQAGPALFILGQQGVYAQVGDSPSGMSPTRKMPGSIGCAGRYAFARAMSDAGEPGVVWLDPQGEGLWFVGVSQAFETDASGRPAELSAPISGEFRRWLLEGQAPLGFTDLSKACVLVDEATRSIWVALGARALVLRAPSMGDGSRQWERYSYTRTGGWAYFAFSPTRRLFGIRATGYVDAFEWYSGAYIGGTLRDGGSAMPTAYWRSANVPGQRRRLSRIGVDMADSSDGCTVASVVQGLTDMSASIPAGKRWVRFPTTRAGFVHAFKVWVSEGTDGVLGVEAEEAALSGGYGR